jgi:hypothetical protein
VALAVPFRAPRASREGSRGLLWLGKLGKKIRHHTAICLQANGGLFFAGMYFRWSVSQGLVLRSAALRFLELCLRSNKSAHEGVQRTATREVPPIFESRSKLLLQRRSKVYLRTTISPWEALNVVSNLFHTDYGSLRWSW